jgi:hypothetical protein
MKPNAISRAASQQTEANWNRVPIGAIAFMFCLLIYKLQNHLSVLIRGSVRSEGAGEE